MNTISDYTESQATPESQFERTKALTREVYHNMPPEDQSAIVSEYYRSIFGETANAAEERFFTWLTQRGLR